MILLNFIYIIYLHVGYSNSTKLGRCDSFVSINFPFLLFAFYGADNVRHPMSIPFSLGISPKRYTRIATCHQQPHLTPSNCSPPRTCRLLPSIRHPFVQSLPATCTRKLILPIPCSSLFAGSCISFTLLGAIVGSSL